jgi:putative ABC transport system substrate-binding protein
VLWPGPASPPNSRIEAFRQGLRELGYVEGRNVEIVYRYAEGDFARLPGLAADLLRLKVDVILGAGAPAVSAAQKATTTIPIVIGTAGDPVGTGLPGALRGRDATLPAYRTSAATSAPSFLPCKSVRCPDCCAWGF